MDDIDKLYSWSVEVGSMYRNSDNEYIVIINKEPVTCECFNINLQKIQNWYYPQLSYYWIKVA